MLETSLECLSVLKSALLWNSSRMSHGLKTNPRLQCYDVLDFWLNPASTQIFQNKFKEWLKIQEQAHQGTYKQDVWRGCPAGEPRCTRWAQMTINTQLWPCNFKMLQSETAQMPKMGHHPNWSHWQMFCLVHFWSDGALFFPGLIIWSTKPAALNYIYRAISSWIRAGEQNNKHAHWWAFLLKLCRVL